MPPPVAPLAQVARPLVSFTLTANDRRGTIRSRTLRPRLRRPWTRHGCFASRAGVTGIRQRAFAPLATTTRVHGHPWTACGRRCLYARRRRVAFAPLATTTGHGARETPPTREMRWRKAAVKHGSARRGTRSASRHLRTPLYAQRLKQRASRSLPSCGALPWAFLSRAQPAVPPPATKTSPCCWAASASSPRHSGARRR